MWEWYKCKVLEMHSELGHSLQLLLFWAEMFTTPFAGFPLAVGTESLPITYVCPGAND